MKTNNRLPYYILGVLVLVALIWRAANPPAPPIPGPLGKMPHWDSMQKLGEMGPWAVNPSGTMWAGAWNQKAKDGSIRSAVWVIDFEKKEARPREMKAGAPVAGLAWAGRSTINVLQPGLKEPMVTLDARTGARKATSALRTTVVGVAAWPSGCPAFIAQTGAEQGTMRFALLSRTGERSGEELSVNMPSGAKPGRWGAIDPRSGKFVFSVAQGETGGRDTYYLADSRTGRVTQIFRSEDLPGRVEGLWVSDDRVLVVVSERDKFHRLVYGAASGKLESLRPGAKLGLSAWPDAPRKMLFVTYNAGYDFNVQTGKARQILDLTKLSRYNGYWREQVQDGRLYPRKDGGYTSVSCLANAIDIRIIDKDGSKSEPLLPRR